MTIQVINPMDETSIILNERRLDPQDVVRLPGMHTGDAIVCTCGILWVTQAGDPEDYMLQKGNTFIAKDQGLVVVQALTPARYRLSSITRFNAGEEYWLPSTRTNHHPAGLNPAGRALEAAYDYRRLKEFNRCADDYDPPARGE